MNNTAWFCYNKGMIDAHVHIFADEIINDRASVDDPQFRIMYGDPKAKMANAEDLLHYMDEFGIERAVVCNMTWVKRKYADINNNYIMDVCARDPKRLFPMVSLPLNFTEKDVWKIIPYLTAGAGIGEQRLTKKSLIDPDSPLSVLHDTVKENDAIMLLHTSEPVGHLYPGKEKMTPDVLEPFIKRSSIPLVLAHFGGGIGFYALMKEVREDLANCYFDTAATPYLYSKEIYPLMISLVGPDKILLGTDYPLMGIKKVMKQIDEADIKKADIAKITHKNAASLFWKA